MGTMTSAQSQTHVEAVVILRRDLHQNVSVREMEARLHAHMLGRVWQGLDQHGYDYLFPRDGERRKEAAWPRFLRDLSAAALLVPEACRPGLGGAWSVREAPAGATAELLTTDGRKWCGAAENVAMALVFASLDARCALCADTGALAAALPLAPTPTCSEAMPARSAAPLTTRGSDPVPHKTPIDLVVTFQAEAANMRDIIIETLDVTAADYGGRIVDDLDQGSGFAVRLGPSPHDQWNRDGFLSELGDTFIAPWGGEVSLADSPVQPVDVGSSISDGSKGPDRAEAADPFVTPWEAPSSLWAEDDAVMFNAIFDDLASSLRSAGPVNIRELDAAFARQDDSATIYVDPDAALFAQVWREVKEQIRQERLAEEKKKSTKPRERSGRTGVERVASSPYEKGAAAVPRSRSGRSPRRPT